MSNLFIFHSLDETTKFLDVFKDNFPDNYFIIEPDSQSIEKNIELMIQTKKKSTLVFLGHGHSSGLYSPESSNFEKKIIIDVKLGNEIFNNKNIILLSCNSNQFIRKISEFNNILGFGNIISSMTEVSIEAEHVTGVYRNINNLDIDFFNKSYSESIIYALKKMTNNKCSFEEIPKIIEFYINKKINKILLNKGIQNRIEISKLLFEFRNEMLFIKNT